MLYQLSWQYRDGTTKLCAQREIDSMDEMRLFVKDTKKSHPLPKYAVWMACNEKSKHFKREGLT